MASFSFLLAILALAATVSSSPPTCRSDQTRSAGASSNATISQALHHVLADSQNGPCSGKFTPHTSGTVNNVGTWSNGSLTFQVHRNISTAQLGQTCVKAFTSIIYNCVEDGNYWGGNTTTPNVRYAIYNKAYPKNWTPASLGTSHSSSSHGTASHATGPAHGTGNAAAKSSHSSSSTAAVHANGTTHHGEAGSENSNKSTPTPTPTPAPVAGNDSYLENGPPTTLDPVQLQASSELAAISRGGLARQSYYSSIYDKTHTTSTSTSSDSAAAPTDVNCDDPTWVLSVSNYNKFKTDQNLKTWWFGGRDTDGVTFQAKSGKNLRFTEALAGDVLPGGSNLDCTLETQQQCQAPDGCENYGVKTVGGRTDPSHWGWFAVHSIANVNSFGASYADGLTNAGVDISLSALDLTKTFTKPSKDPQIKTRDILTAFSLVIIASFVFVPVAGGALAAGGAASLGVQAAGATGVGAGVALSDAPAFLGNALASSSADLDTKAADFGAFMQTAFNSSSSGIDTFISNLMAGENIDGPAGGTPTLNRLLNGGGWVNSDIVTNPAISISSLTTMLYQNLLQRGINHIWSQSKIWVSFADLGDDASMSKCLADKKGWQASKTCADGGVYYLYRFNEHGTDNGDLAYPWGADKMTAEPWNLDPSWVTKSSAKSYRAQGNGGGGFAYDPATVPSELPSLYEAASKGSLSEFNGMEGTWNISVCDMGTHSDWNFDFTNENAVPPDGKALMPCCCGPQCSQTADFVRSAQMENFGTLPYNCKQQLSSCAAWPAGVTQIDYGEAGTISKDTCK